MAAILGSIIGIIVCGGVGGVGGWLLVTLLGLSGVPGAIGAASLGMVLAVALWAAGAGALRALGRGR